MNAGAWTAFAVFAFAASITPGPNNLMLLASGVNHGFRRTLPHLFGVCLGFLVMLLAVGAGLASLFQRWPVLHPLLQILGATYLAWLALGLARTRRGPDAAASQPPMSLWAAAAFQWVNPKAWMMGVTAFTTYLAEPDVWGVLALSLLFALINLPCLSCWTLLGSRLRGWLAQGNRQHLFNLGMAALLLLSLIPLLG